MARRLIIATTIVAAWMGQAGHGLAEDSGSPAAAEKTATERTAPGAAAPNATDRQGYVDIVRREASARGLPPDVAEAVAFVESGFEPSAVGGVGEIGLMQIRPATAVMLGHAGGALGLFEPETNARFAVRYLAGAWKLAGGDLCRALMKYRAGHGAEVLSPLSAQYCLRAKRYLAGLGSPLADGVAPEVVAIHDLPGDRPLSASAEKVKYRGPYLGWRPGKHTASDNARFWARHETRIRAIEAKIERRTKVRMAKGS